MTTESPVRISAADTVDADPKPTLAATEALTSHRIGLLRARVCRLMTQSSSQDESRPPRLTARSRYVDEASTVRSMLAVRRRPPEHQARGVLGDPIGNQVTGPTRVRRE